MHICGGELAKKLERGRKKMSTLFVHYIYIYIDNGSRLRSGNEDLLGIAAALESVLSYFISNAEIVGIRLFHAAYNNSG